LASSLEAKLTAVDHEVKTHTERTKVTDREVAHLKTWTEQLKDVEQFRERHSQAAAHLETQAFRIGKVEQDIVQICSDAFSQSQLQNSELNNLEQAVSQNKAETARWMDTQRAHVDLISSSGRRLQDLETSQSKLLAFSDNAELDIRNLATWRQTVAKDIEEHSTGLEATRAGLSRAHESNTGTAEIVQSLKGDFSAERELLKKLGARVDQCYKYFNGFGKGLQDTSKQMHNMEGSMLLPPKLGGGTMLPTLPTMTMPKTPRTPRGGLPTPRKKLSA